MLIPRSDLLHRPEITCSGFVFLGASGPVFSSCWGRKFSNFPPPVGLARCFLHLWRWPDSLCHRSIQMCFWGHYQLHPVSAYQCVFFPPSVCIPLPLFSGWRHHIFAVGCLCETPGFPFSWLLLSCVSVWHAGSFKVKLKRIRPSVPLCFHLVRTSEGPKMSLRAACGILEWDPSSKQMLAPGNVYRYRCRYHSRHRRQQSAHLWRRRWNLDCSGCPQNNPLETNSKLPAY